MQVELKMELLSAEELGALMDRVQEMRDGFARGDAERKRRPELAEFFATLLGALDDERRRREKEAKYIEWMMRHGDRPAPGEEPTNSGWGPDARRAIEQGEEPPTD